MMKAQKTGGINLQEFNKDCGIGVILTEEDILKIVQENIQDATEKSSLFEYMAKIKTQIPYIEGKVLKAIL